MENYYIAARKKGQPYFYFIEYRRNEPQGIVASMMPPSRVRENPSTVACSKVIADEAQKMLQERGYEVIIIKNDRAGSLDYLLLAEELHKPEKQMFKK